MRRTQSLADDGEHGRGDQERLDPHVEEPVQRRDGVRGVERRDHEVTGEGRLHGHARRLDVTDLTDEDHVGVLAQDRLQSRGERESSLVVRLNLVDGRETRTRPDPRSS